MIEVVTYCPMLGTAGSYLGFVTGNLTNLKVPAALTAMENAKVKPGRRRGSDFNHYDCHFFHCNDSGSICLGVLMLAQLTPILNSPQLKPAFDNILPALFGGLAVVYVSKNWKIAMAPLIFMIALFLAVPALASSVGFWFLWERRSRFWQPGFV